MARKKTFKSTKDLLAGMRLSPEVTESVAKTIGIYSLAQKLTLLRVQAGLTRKELAAKSGLTARDISHIETVPNELQRLKAIASYAKAFDHEIVVTLRRRGKATTVRSAPITGGGSMKKRCTGISEKAFVKAVRELYPNALFHELDEKDFDDVWIRGIGYWEADRVLYSRSDKNIRMWRNFGGYDRHFKNLNAFKEWLESAHANNHKFEETSEAAE